MAAVNPRKALLFALRLAVFLGAAAFVLTQIDLVDRTVIGEDGTSAVEPGVLTLFAGAHLGWVALAFLSFFLFTLCGVLRWWFLLLAQGIHLTLPEAFRLSYIGLFFGNIIPGVTGGDLVKAVYVARRVPEARARAVTTIFIDRAMGLVALMVLGCLAALVGIGHPVFRDAALLLISLLVVGCVLITPVLFKPLRRPLRVEPVLRLLPFQDLLREVDAAIQLYRHRVGAVSLIFGFSVVGQVFGLIDAWFMARALGIDLPILSVLIIVPVVQVFCILPVSPGAWGVGEGLFVYFFGFIGLGASPAASISIGCRLIFTAQTLLGGLFLLGASEEVRAARREAARQQIARPAPADEA